MHDSPVDTVTGCSGPLACCRADPDMTPEALGRCECAPVVALWVVNNDVDLVSEEHSERDARTGTDRQ